MILAFDIDGTIIERNVGDVQVECLRKASEIVLNKKFEVDFDYSGMMDWEIVQRIVKKKIKKRTFEEIFRVSADLFKKSCPRILLKEDILELLENFSGRKVIITGNIKEIALYKLKKAGIIDYFDLSLSGFGDEFLRREDLLKRVAKEGFVLYFGDTKKDLETVKRVISKGYKVAFCAVPE